MKVARHASTSFRSLASKDGRREWQVKLVVAAIVLLAAVLVTSGAAANDFASKANGICESYYRKLNQIPAPATPTATAIVSYEKRVRPLGLAELATFKLLTPPSADKQTYSTWIKTTEQAAALEQQSITAGEKGNSSTVLRLTAQLDKLNTTYDSLAAKMGLKICAQPTSKSK
jgi:hypothetical protein